MSAHRPRPQQMLASSVVALVAIATGCQSDDAVPRRAVARSAVPSAEASPPGAPAVVASLAPRASSADATRPAPWQRATLRGSDVSPVALEAAQSTAVPGCVPLLPDPRTYDVRGQPRRASYGGGWGVAWDVQGGPGQMPSGRTSPTAGRSTYGIAGTGRANPGVESVWQQQLSWVDGSRAGYGVEGHPELQQATGVKWLAYLTVAGHDCLYNVWDNYGRADLLRLISALRYVSS